MAGLSTPNPRKVVFSSLGFLELSFSSFRALAAGAGSSKCSVGCFSGRWKRQAGVQLSRDSSDAYRRLKKCLLFLVYAVEEFGGAQKNT